MTIVAQTINLSDRVGTSESIVVRCRRGDKRAFSELFYAHKEIVYRYIFKMLGRVDRTDELVQDVFIEIAKSISSFNENAKITTWIYRITMNVCMQYLRDKHRKKNQIFLPNGVETDSLQDKKMLNAEQRLVRQGTYNEIREALDRLDTKKRAIIVLHDMEGISMKEIAIIVNIPMGTVQSRLLHARKKLKSYLVKQGFTYVV